MSDWVHITACLSVDTFIESDTLQSIVLDALKDAPKITGSEGDAEMFVNIPRGYNTAFDQDCEHCEKRVDGACIADVNYGCPEGKYQTCAVITVQGDLRNRIKYTTEKEFNEFLEYIDGMFMIRSYSVNYSE